MEIPETPRKNDGSNLISNWCIVTDELGQQYQSYYHKWYGWMIKGKSQGFNLGYTPVINKIIQWKYL